MRRPILLAMSLVLASVLAGCTGDDTRPDDGDGGGGYGTVSAVSFSGNVPDQGVAGSPMLVCWDVAGSGTIRETGIATDTVSQADSNDRADYAGATYYPDNETAAVERTAPGTFCTAVSLPDAAPASGILYLRAYAIADAAPGKASPAERAVTVVPADLNTVSGVTIASAPGDGPAEGAVEVCWTINGNGHAQQTGLYTDDTSHGNSTDIGVYTGATYYPGNATAAASVDIPGTFCADVALPTNGTLYVRAHALDRNGAPGILSDEVTIDARGVVDNVTFQTGGPENRWSGDTYTALPDEMVEVCWRVDGRGVIGHTALHTDNESHPQAPSFQVYNGTLYFPDNAATAPQVEVPGTFCAEVPAPESGTTYVRAHAIGYGQGLGIISPDERQITVILGS